LGGYASTLEGTGRLCKYAGGDWEAMQVRWRETALVPEEYSMVLEGAGRLCKYAGGDWEAMQVRWEGTGRPCEYAGLNMAMQVRWEAM